MDGQTFQESRIFGLALLTWNNQPYCLYSEELGPCWNALSKNVFEDLDHVLWGLPILVSDFDSFSFEMFGL